MSRLFSFFSEKPRMSADSLAIALLHGLVYGPGFCAILRLFEIALVLVRLDHAA
jgi:hypothetical protein